MINWIADGIVLAILIVCVVIGVKRGFIRSAVRLIGTLVAIVLAFYISSPLAEWVFDATLKDNIVQSIGAQIDASTGASVEEQVANALGGLPEWLQNAVEAYVGTPQEIGAIVAKQGAETAQSATDALVTFVVRPLCVFLLQILCFIVLFILLFLLVLLLSRLMDKLFKLPVMRQINGLFGGITGLFIGIVIVLAVVAALQAWIAVGGSGAIPKTVLTDTYLVSFVADHDPILYPKVITEALSYWKV
ncbi:MAG: CvpA family protein [Clostridia bacterium]|nr:CvpA family protein [Clostridia bacterium]